MSEQKAALLMMKGAISELPDADQKKVYDVAERLRSVIREAGDAGKMALALVGIEYTLED